MWGGGGERGACVTLENFAMTQPVWGSVSSSEIQHDNTNTTRGLLCGLNESICIASISHLVWHRTGLNLGFLQMMERDHDSS